MGIPEQIREFYTSLPKIQEVSKSDFYVPGYTETLTEVFDGVRVIPNESWVELIPEVFHTYIDTVRIPCYIVPFFIKNRCYGFLFKGVDKPTPRFVTLQWLLLGAGQVPNDQPIIICEGLKDVYVLRKAGLPALPALSSGIPKDTYVWLKQCNHSVLFVPDNDRNPQNRIDFLRDFGEKADTAGVTWSWFQLSRVKDLGDYFLPECQADALSEVRDIIQVYRGMYVR